MLIQLYNGVKDNTGKEIDIAEAIEKIKSKRLQVLIKNLRNLIEINKSNEAALATREANNEGFAHYAKESKGQIDNFKKELPAVTWSGTFTKRKITHLKEYSKLICLDIDNLSAEDFTKFRQQLCSDPYAHICFTSPGGEGIKIIFKVNHQGYDISNVLSFAADHTMYFVSIEKYFLDNYKIQIDKSGKDISRLCFLSYDENIFINNTSAVYELQEPNKEPAKIIADVKPLTKKEEKVFGAVDTPHDVFLFTEKKISYTAGNRNRFLNLFCNNCKRKGISMTDCSDYCFANMPDREKAEIVQTVENAYNKNQHEHGKYAKKAKSHLAINKTENRNLPVGKGHTGSEEKRMDATGRTKGTAANNTKASPLLKPAEHTAEKERFTTQDELFWYTTINEKTNRETLSLSYGKFFDWLQSQGFYNLKIDKKSVELIRIENGIVDPVIIDNTQNDVKTYINTFCKKHSLIKVLEMLHRGEDKYFSRKKFINLNFKSIEFLRDTADQSFYFHNNCVVEVTKYGITTRAYKDGEKALWRSQIIEKDFNYVPFEQPFDKDGRIDARQMKCEWAQFQALVSSNPDVPIDAKTANNRFYSHATSFGYLINGYKPSDGKAIVAVDHQKGQDRMQQNGRTGKGVVAKAVGYAKKRYNVNGRTYDPRDSSVFDAVTMDVKVITVTDCGPNFDFGNFFVPITEDFTFRKLYIGYVTIPFALSPKWYFDTNFSFKGDGGSFEGRQHIIEFDNFFTPTHRPAHFFGHQLFIDWSEEQWNLFYNYCYWCDMLYKQNGLIEYPSGNYSDRKLMNECPQEFIDWLDATNDDGTHVIPHNKKLEKLDIYGKWKIYAEQWGITKSSAKAFTGYMQKYCAVRNLEYIRHKTGSKEYVWVSDGSIEAEKLKLMGELQFK